MTRELLPCSPYLASRLPSGLGSDFPSGPTPPGNYILFDPNSDLADLAFPVIADHYSMKLGPGITAQATVVLMH